MYDSDESSLFQPTFLGGIMTRYYLRFETAAALCQIDGRMNFQQFLDHFSKSKEFEDTMRVRMGEKGILNKIVKAKNSPARWRIATGIKELPDKVNALVQAKLGHIKIDNFNLLQDQLQLFGASTRIARSFVDYLLSKEDKFLFAAIQNAM